MDVERTLSIGIAGNTAIPTVQAIAAKGYKISLEFHSDTPGEWDNPRWEANKDGRFYFGTSPEEVLGLIAMWEVRGDEWRLKPGESDLYDQLYEAATMFDSQGNIVDQ